MATGLLLGITWEICITLILSRTGEQDSSHISHYFGPFYQLCVLTVSTFRCNCGLGLEMHLGNWNINYAGGTILYLYFRDKHKKVLVGVKHLNIAITPCILGTS